MGFTTDSRGEVPGKKERTPVTRHDDDDNNNNYNNNNKLEFACCMSSLTGEES
jgi:hypothetical protein